MTGLIQILQCVTVNLTVLYALLAYTGVKHKLSHRQAVCNFHLCVVALQTVFFQ